MSDEEILKLSYDKPSHFGELFDRYHKHFLAIAKRTLRSRDDAEDVVQETFVKIYKYGKKFSSDSGSRFRPWANTILRNCMADQINKYKKNATVPLNEEIESITPDFSVSMSMQDDRSGEIFGDRDYVRFILKKIGGAAAEMINLRYVLGKSFKEIGRILNIKSNTARVRAHRSKKIFIRIYQQFNNNYYE